MSAEREEHRAEQPMADASPAGQAGQVEPLAVGPGEPAPAHRPDGEAGAALPTETRATAETAPTDLPAATAPSASTAATAPDGEDASLLSLVDRLAVLLERSDLGELEVTAGGTTIILRAPSAIERAVAVPGSSPAADGPAASAGATAVSTPTPTPAAAPPARPSVKAPLTGIFYGAPSPGATAYVAVGDHVSVGQIIGLIEAMKLFNEIKSDLAGRVVRICADNGALVKARQPLIEVEPA
jgi:acetyl-CoA carboxylase biotin carboxyl carrier protein